MRYISALFLAGFILFAASPHPAAAEGIAKVLYVNLSGSLSPWTLSVSADGSVVWDNTSNGQLFMEPPFESKEGKVSPARCRELFALIEKNGYAVKLPFEGIEPRIRLTVAFDSGRLLVNLGPSIIADKGVESFAEVEKMLLEIAAEAGIQAQGFYNP